MLDAVARTAGVEAGEQRRERRRHGAVGLPGGAVRWRVWAPRARTVELVLIDGDRRQAHAMTREADATFSHIERAVPENQLYAYRLDGGAERPDPCSLWQPHGVHGPSALVRPERFLWSDRSWEGVRRADLVFYELHVGTFTPDGTFAAAIPRLPDLKELGVTALEIMPVAQFPGERNWGYDGVQLYATQNSYGGPHGLQRLVDACHAAGLAIFLDVVYNHLGPEGNYLGEFGPYFTDRYKTPWGPAVNYDGPGCDGVRDFILEDARLWLDEFHFDGLRLDAVHAIFDLGARPILRAVQEVAEDVSARHGRPVHVVAESDLNDPRLLLPPERGGLGLDAQWSDDFHHAVHAYLTGEHQGYYADFGTAGQLTRVLERPFLYAGDYSPFRGRRHGAPPDGLSGDRFVVCLQNHDQIGNRARGERLIRLLESPAQARLAASLLLLSPYLPLLFMGEEYGEENPFPFFCSFGDAQLVEAVREGRQREFAEFAWRGEVPDPHGTDTFEAARLTWSWPEGSARAARRRLYQDLLRARRRWPALREVEHRTACLVPDPDTGPLLELLRGVRDTGLVRCLFNLSGRTQSLPSRPAAGESLLYTSEGTRYGGSRGGPTVGGELLPYESVVFGPGAWRGALER